MPLALLLLLLVGGGTGVVAEKALPGDVLYPVKIHVNENIESALALTARGDAEVAIKQAARRLEEVEKLKAVVGTTTPEQNAQLQAAVLGELGNFNKQVLKVRGKDSKSADELTEKLQKKLDDHFEAFSLVTSSVNASSSPELVNIIRVKNGRGEHGGWTYIVATSSNSTSTPVFFKKRGDEGEKNEIRREDRKGEEFSRGRDSDDDEDEDEDDDDRSYGGPTPVPPVQVTPPASGNGGSTSNTVTKYTLAQVAAHKSSTDCWSVVSGGVYNLTSWIAQHPGGEAAIKGMCGVDATSAFMSQHGGQGNPAKELAAFKIGVLQ